MNNDTLKGKTALVTGAAKRIGRAIALRLAEAGAHIVIHYHSSEDASVRALSSEIKKFGVNAWNIKVDFSNNAETKKLFTTIKKQAGKIDFLINNASVFPASHLGNLSVEELNKTMTINAYAPLILSQAFTKQTTEGAIINILDTRINGCDYEHASYQLSKLTLHHLTIMMAREYAPHIQVNAIAPGPILPPEGKDDSYLKKIGEKTLLGRHGTVRHITESVLFLLSSSYVTGEVLFVDGGEHLQGRTYGKKECHY